MDRKEAPVASPVKVEFLFDFGSPNAYLADLVIPQIERRSGVKFDYVPVLLGGIFKATGNVSPAESLRDIKNKREFMMVEMHRFIRRHNITTFRQNPFFPVNTLMLMRGAVAAQFEGVFEPYVRAGFHHMWEEPKKMDDPEVIRAALDASGIDGAHVLARIQDQEIKDALLHNTEASVARGTFGSPTFFVGDEIFFGKDRLREVEEQIVSRSPRSQARQGAGA